MGGRIRSLDDTIFDIVNYIFAGLCFFLIAYPLIYVISASFSSPTAVSTGKVWLFPVDPSVASYGAIFRNTHITSGYANSIKYTICGTIVSVLVTILAAYPLSFRDFYGKGFISSLMIFTMLFSGGLIPNYLLVSQLKMLNTIWAMIIPGAFGVWNIVLTRTYIQSNIPHELHEAAELDGCGDFMALLLIVIPLCKPIIAVMVLYSMIGIWNSYFDALIYLNKQNMYPLQIILRDILIQNTIDPANVQNMDIREQANRLYLINTLKYGIIVVSSAPLLIVYPFVQKYFIKGVMIGSLKG